MSGDYSIVEEMAPGGALIDVDQDGDLDLYLVQGRMLGEGKTFDDAIFQPRHPLPLSDRLYRNDLVETGVFGFTDVTAESGLSGFGYGMGVTAGDVDNDGWPDLYVTNYGSNQLLRNRGDGTFEDVTARAGVDDERMSMPAVFFDFDRDGWLDLYVGNYVHYPADNPPVCHDLAGARDYCGPDGFRPEPDRLWRNLGPGPDGTVRFEDVTVDAGLANSRAPALGAVAADFNGDGWLDLFVANDSKPNHLWINEGGSRFTDRALLAGCAVNAEGQAEGSMGVNAEDFDGDGDLDLFVTHFVSETNTLYLNDGRGNFTDGTEASGLGAPSRRFTAFGTAAIDVDNDGWLDLLVANGAVNKIEALARQGDPFPLHQPNQLFRNLGGGRFREVTASAGVVFELSEVSRGVLAGDLDNDGDADVMVVNNSGPARILINETGHRRHWLGLRLIDETGARDVPGARAMVERDGRPALWRRSGVADSYAGARDPRLLFGLGDDPRIAGVQVVWPGGTVERWADVPNDRYTTLRRGSGERGAVAEQAVAESVGLTGPTGPTGLSPTGPTRPTTSANLRPVPEPDLTSAEPRVREQISAQRAAVDASEATAEAFGMLGLIYLAYDFQEAAEACFDNARVLAPGDVRWSYLSGYLLQSQGRLATAVHLLEDSVRLEPERVPILLRLARVRFELGQHEVARDLFQRVLDLDASLAAAHHGLGKVAVAEGDPTAAVAHFSAALEHAPEATSLHYVLAQAYRDLGDLERARAHLERRGEVPVVVPDPLLEPLAEIGAGAHVYLTRGAAALSEGAYRTAATLYRRALTEAPESFTAYRGLSYAVEHLGDLEGAIAHLETALAVATTRDAEKDRRERAEILRLLGGLTALAGRDEEAIRHLERSLELVPDQGDARRKLANALARAGRFEDALPHWDRLLAAHPEHAATLYLQRAAVLVNLGRADDAVADFERAVAADPGDARSRLRYAAALDFLGRPGGDHQRAAAERLNRSQPERARLKVSEARQAREAGELEAAVEILRQAVSLAPDDHAARYELASALADLGNFDPAIAEYRRVALARPRHAAARRGEIVALLSSGRFGEARVRLQEGLKLFPRDVRLAHAQARLLATSPDSRVRDGALALQIAERLVAASDGPRIRETLAMAYAEARRVGARDGGATSPSRRGASEWGCSVHGAARVCPASVRTRRSLDRRLWRRDCRGDTRLFVPEGRSHVAPGFNPGSDGAAHAVPRSRPSR